LSKVGDILEEMEQDLGPLAVREMKKAVLPLEGGHYDIRRILAMKMVDLINEVAIRTDMNKSMVKRVLAAFVESVGDALKRGEEVPVTDLGVFSKTFRNPRRIKGFAGEQDVPARWRPRFKPYKFLRDCAAH